MTVATVGPVPSSSTASPGTGTVGAGPDGVMAPGDQVGSSVGAAAFRNSPHAASVFYAVDASLRLVFLSKPSSLHGMHIGSRAQVAATITEQYDDWEAIQGVQVWGEARLLKGADRMTALAVYLARFPFVEDMVKRPEMAAMLKGIGVYRVAPCRLAFTDNTTGVFGREVLDMRVE